MPVSCVFDESLATEEAIPAVAWLSFVFEILNCISGPLD